MAANMVLEIGKTEKGYQALLCEKRVISAGCLRSETSSFNWFNNSPV